MPKMRALIMPLLILAALGSAAVLAIHVAALFGLSWPFQYSFILILAGLIPVFVPATLLVNDMIPGFRRQYVWRAVVRRCPAWMSRAFYAVFAYGWVAFFALPRIYGGDMNGPANKARSMSAVMLIFYLMPLLVFYSAVRLETDHLRRCLNGHRLSALAKHCEECGAPPGS